MNRKWEILQKESDRGDAAPEAASAIGIIERLLLNRGLTTRRDVHEYLNPDLIYCHSPFLMEDMNGGIARIRRALENGELIGIFSDSDLDGITSLVILHNLLKKLSVSTHLRHLKEDEQYGLTREIIQEFIDAGARLIITVDSGIRDIDEIRYSRENGVDVIVIDHHEQDTNLPDAIIINPKIHGCRYPFKELAGVGVTFKLCLALLLSYLPGFNRSFLLTYYDGSSWHLGSMRDGILEKTDRFADKMTFIESLAFTCIENCIAVCADDDSYEAINGGNKGLNKYRLADLAEPLERGGRLQSLQDIFKTLSMDPEVYESPLELISMIVFFLQIAGSKKIMSFLNDAVALVAIGTVADVVPLLGENRNLVFAGLKQLEKTSHRGLEKLINGDRINSKKIGWGIAPLLNAPGRVGKTSLTLDFFLKEDEQHLQTIIDEIKSINNNRKDSVLKICEILIGSYNETGTTYRNIVVMKSSLIPEGYAGLIANKLSDSLEKPVIAISLQEGKDLVKGSGRCGKGIDFFSALNRCAGEFERVGGHSQAFGFTIDKERIDAVMELIDTEMDSLNVTAPPVIIDCELPLSSVSVHLADMIERMEPIGKDNEIPLFLARSIHIRSFSRMGNGKHGKFNFKEPRDLYAIGWSMADEMEKLFKEGDPIDMVYRIEKNSYMGRVEPRIVIIEIANSDIFN